MYTELKFVMELGLTTELQAYGLHTPSHSDSKSFGTLKFYCKYVRIYLVYMEKNTDGSQNDKKK